MANKLTPEEKAARAAARRAAAQEKKEQSTQEVVEHSRPVADPQPVDGDPTDQRPADDEQPEQEVAEASQEKAAPSAERKEEVPLSPATAYADSPAEAAARAAETEAADRTEQSQPAASDSLTAKGQQILKEYPAADEVYMTSNGFGFFREQDARNHATTLRDKTVINVKRK